jgi:PAS domain S-box-containing protein
MNISETIASEYRKTVSKSVREKDEEPYEIMSLRKDGSTFPIEIHAKPFPFNGRIVRVAAVRDITERKQAEELLQQEKETFYTILQNALYGVGLIDSDGSYLYVNPEFTKITGYTLKDIPTGKDWMHKAYPDKEYRQKAIETWKKDIGVGGIRRVFSVVCKDGKTREIEFRPTQLDDGRAVTMLMDITERRRMEEQLQQSEEQFRTFFDNSLDGILLTEPDGSILAANPAACQMFGRTEEELYRRGRKKLVDQEDPKFQVFLKERARTGSYRGELTYLHKDGTKIPCDISSIIFKDKHGADRVITIIRDITERKEMEEQLQKSEALYRTLIETTKVGVSAINENGVILYANDRHCEIWGYPLNEIMGHRVSEFLDEENLKILQEQLVKRKEGEQDPYEIAWKRKDGKSVPTILSPTPIFDTDGRYKGSYGFITDITERKQMEQALQESQQGLQTLMDASPVGICWADMKGNIKYNNRKFHELFGYTVEDIPNIPEWRRQAYPDPDYRDQIPSLVGLLTEAQKQGKEADPIEVTVTCKNGSIRHVMQAGAFASNRILAIYSDITERKQMEERLKHYAAEMERSNEEVKNFAYIVSHDLRVPLVNLKGYTSELRSALEVIGSNMDTTLPHLNEDKRSAVAMALHEDVPEALEFITNSASRMDSFINSVLQLSRLGRRELKPEPIDMNALVQMNLETLAHQIKERDIKVTVGSLPQVVADRTSMEQIMGNVLGNAVKYLDLERPGQIEITAQTNNGEQLFRISDNGRGIAEEDMHKVFAPFRRAGKEDTPGEGMGLAYVQTLVRRHNGRIWCESEIGKGTTMTFTISQHRKEGGEHVSDR